MSSISCHCFNVNVQLVSPPILTTDQKWLAEQIGATKIGDAKIKSSGPFMELENLVSTRMVAGWKVYKCCNCYVDVCAIDTNNNSCLVNMDLEEHSGNSPHMLTADGKRFYSPCFRIILEDSDHSETPGVTTNDPQATDTFNKLQQQVDAYSTAEERAMEKRIKAFIKEQQGAFNALKSRANKDRAILWRRLCKINSSYGSKQNVAPVSQSNPITTSPAFKVSSSAPSTIAPITTKSHSISSTSASSTSKKPEDKPVVEKSWQSAELSKQSPAKNFHLTSSSTDGAIFTFDDEDEGISEPFSQPTSQVPAQNAHTEELSDEEVEEATKPSEPLVDNVKMLGTSLPIHILNPQILAGRIRPPEVEVEVVAQPLQVPVPESAPDALKKRAPRESWSSKSVIGEELPAELAASFAVPLSLNRRIKSLI